MSASPSGPWSGKQVGARCPHRVDADEAYLTMVLDTRGGLVAVEVVLPPIAARVLDDVYGLDPDLRGLPALGCGADRPPLVHRAATR